MNSNISIIIGRELKERIAKKSFIITTLLGPILMILLMAAPSLIMMMSSPDTRKIAVADKSGVILPALIRETKDNATIVIEPSDAPADKLIHDENYDCVLAIEADIVEHPENVTLYTHESGSIELEKTIIGVMEKAIGDERLKAYDIENIERIIADSKVDVYMRTVRVDDNGDVKDTSSAISMILGMLMTFILYMFLLMYGQMVMTSIIEEKNNRVLELVVSSVKPTDLMMGKIIGVGLVAVIQIVIWAILVCGFAGIFMPMLMPENMATQVDMFNSGTFNASASTMDPSMVEALAMFSSVGYVAGMFGYMGLFLVGGFLFYAAIFAAIGSAVDNIQDASQLTTFATMPIILGIIFAMTAASDPNTSLALWLSMIPFTSPMVMMARVPFDIPAWQIWVSLAILYTSFLLLAWIAGKIYRVGIFMYGKKPTFADLIKWARYK